MTKDQFEKHLNALYADCLSYNEAIDSFIYLTNKQRGKRTTERNIINAYTNHTLGSLLRKYDSIAFNSAYNSKYQ